MGESAGGHPVDDEIAVFLVDDHTVVRSGLAAYLATEPGMRVVGEAADGRRALAELAVLDGAGALPDVVLMDLLMPELDGIATTAEIKGRWPQVEVVAVTSFLEEAKIRGALEAGAAGYLLKDADAADVVAAIRSAVPARCTWTPPPPGPSPPRCAPPDPSPSSPRASARWSSSSPKVAATARSPSTWA